MDATWLSVQSMKLNHSIIGAINTLSIHLKLTSGGEQGIKPESEIEEAKTTIEKWITEFEKSLNAYEQNSFQALTGINPRQQQLVKRFESAKRKGEFSSKIFRDPPTKIIGLLSSGQPENIKELLQSLSDLRALLEEHNQLDIQNLVPDL
ncbi:MAG: hypothetical protein JST75_09565 [Bacteroidetes bacterium]|nr:hypothetical protein [Bacteroidota bacterium]